LKSSWLLREVFNHFFSFLFLHFNPQPLSKSSPAYLKKIEILLKEAGLKLRYEKGNFKSGHCLLEDQQIVVVNKFYTVETKIQALTDMLQQMQLPLDMLTPESRLLYQELQQTGLKL
jgi:hypothetical protein